MRSHLGEPLTVDRLADEAARARVISLGPSQLRRSSHPPRPSSGSASRAARAQVESSNDSIEQIVEAVGFSDPHDRSRFTLKSLAISIEPPAPRCGHVLAIWIAASMLSAVMKLSPTTGLGPPSSLTAPSGWIVLVAVTGLLLASSELP